MNWILEAVKLGLIERVEMGPEKAKLGRKTQHIKKKKEKRQPIQAENMRVCLPLGRTIMKVEEVSVLILGCPIWKAISRKNKQFHSESVTLICCLYLLFLRIS